MITQNTDEDSFKKRWEFINSVEISQADLDSMDSCEICHIHNDKRIEAFCKADDELLWVLWILDNNHKHHDVITLSKAFKEQKLYIKYKFSKLYKNKDLLTTKEKHIVDMLDSLEQNRDHAILEAEDFYNNMLEAVHNAKTEFISTINKNFNNYKRDLELLCSQVTHMVDNLQNMKQLSLNFNTEKDTIDFIKYK